MQQLLDHVLSKKLKSARSLVLQSPDGKQLISNRLEENADAYKEVAYQVQCEQSKLTIGYGSVRYINICDKYNIAYGILDHPHWSAFAVLWNRFQPDIKLDIKSCQAEQDDLNWLKANWTQLISTFKAADYIFRHELAKREEITMASLQVENCATSNAPGEIAVKISSLFEDRLLKRSSKIENDCWDSVGAVIFRNKIEQQIRKGGPIHFIMPSFPFKSSNTRTKVLGELPDMAEKLALERLEGFLHSLRSIYSAGGKLLKFSGGRVYCDLFRVADRVASEYNVALQKMVDPTTSDIEWADLDDIYPYPYYTNDGKRQALLNIFGTSLDKIVDRINSDADFCEVYNGFKKFLLEELTFPSQWSDSAVQQECGTIAELAVQRNDAYQTLIRCIYPDHIRLSIHPSTNTTKYSVNLVGKTDWGTPWHNCALLQPDRSWELIRKATAENNGFELRKRDDRMHYFINNGGVVFTENL